MRPSRNLLLLLAGWVLLGFIATVARLLDWQYGLQISFLFWTTIVFLLLITLLDGFASRWRPKLKVERQLDPYLALSVRQSVFIKVTNQTSLKG